MTVLHLVIVKFNEGTDQATRKEFIDRILALKTSCVHPTTKAPYIKSFVGGKDSSVEGLQNGHTHGFVAEFETEEDRYYYAKEDPVHLELVKTLVEREILEKITVVDFTPGMF